MGNGRLMDLDMDWMGWEEDHWMHCVFMRLGKGIFVMLVLPERCFYVAETGGCSFCMDCFDDLYPVPFSVNHPLGSSTTVSKIAISRTQTATLSTTPQSASPTRSSNSPLPPIGQSMRRIKNPSCR